MAIDKRKTRARIKRLSQIKTWQLVILILMSGFVSATFLRLNNVGMIERRDAVIDADISGDTAALNRRLYDLQRYVSSHMNADPGRIALDHSYQRDNQKKKAEKEQEIANQPNGDVYQKAEAVCGPLARSQGWRWPDLRYTNCLNQELAKYPEGKVLSTEFEPIPVETYYHTFISPLWSPDFAGWSVLITGALALIIVMRIIVLIILKAVIRHRNRQF